MNDLCVDMGWKSLNKYGEQLCGDHVEISGNRSSQVAVLADGLGSGVKASILSTLTARILATMMAADMPVEDCIGTIAATLPVCSERGVAYSTFTIIRIVAGREAEIIQYDNPRAILLREGKPVDIPAAVIQYGEKTIFRSRIPVREDDIFLTISDGAVHAGVGNAYNLGWQRDDIIDYMSRFCHAGYTAKTLASILIEECDRLYGGRCGDDTTACVLRIRRRKPVNLLLGPPASQDDNERMLALFFSKEGSHIICGGTTAAMAARYLGKGLVSRLDFPDPAIPPMADIEGIDLVTEGVITINRVLEYANDYLADNQLFRQWSFGRDGASQVARMLFEDATDINFYVGKAVNPAHQDPELPINFSVKMNLVEELASSLTRMGKQIKVSYF